MCNDTVAFFRYGKPPAVFITLLQRGMEFMEIFDPSSVDTRAGIELSLSNWQLIHNSIIVFQPLAKVLITL